MIRLIYVLLVLFGSLAHAQYLDANGREWMRIDSTFGFAGQLPSLCNPDCSGVVTQYSYDIRLNSFSNPRQISLEGYRWANKDEAQELMKSTDLLNLGTSVQFVTTYSASAAVYATTSTIDPVSALRYVAFASFGHNMVSFSYNSGFLLGVTAVQSGQVGGLLYRSRTVQRDCVFNGQILKSGQSVTAFKSASVAYNQTCQSEVRSCTDGTLSGSFTATSCSVTAPLNCSFNGQTILHGQTVSGYSIPSATSLGTYGTFCSKSQVTRTCINGSLNGNLYPACSQTVLDPNRCRLKDGVIKCKS